MKQQDDGPMSEKMSELLKTIGKQYEEKMEPTPGPGMSKLLGGPQAKPTPPKPTASAEKPKVKRVGEPWVKPVKDIPTAENGFHEVAPQPPNSKRPPIYIPCYTDLREAFEQDKPYVTYSINKEVYIWDGKRYEPIPELEIKGFAEDRFKPACDNKKANEFFGSVLRHNRRGPEFFRADKLVNFQNGWLDIEKMEFHPHSPTVGFRYVLDYDFDENATCPTWDKFLGRVLCGDEVLSQIVNEFIGYSLVGADPWADKCLLARGEGSNGKSTFFYAVRALLGKDATTACKMSDLSRNGTFSTQRLDGKLANISEETPKDSWEKSAVFKDLVSGGCIEGQKKYGDPYDFYNKAKFFFSCNDLPQNADQSHGFYRRFLIIPFLAKFSEAEADPFMRQKLAAELPGIFNKALAAYKDLEFRGHFAKSKTVDAEVEQYKKDSNPFLQWMEDFAKVVEGSDAEIKSCVSCTATMLEEFNAWCKASGFATRSATWFGRELGRLVTRDRLGREKDDNRRQFRCVYGVQRANGDRFKPLF